MHITNPVLWAQDWLHEARSGVIRLPRQSTFLTREAYWWQGKNAFQIGRDYQSGLDRRHVQPLTALERKGA